MRSNKNNYTGCMLCKFIEWVEADTCDGFSDPYYSGWSCSKRDDVDNFKTFPCKRKLRCFEVHENSELLEQER